MPQIRQFDAGNVGLQPTEVGVESTAQAGNRIGRFFNQAGAGVMEVGREFARNLGGAIRDLGQVAVNYETHREISHGAAAFAQLNDGLTQQWNDIAKNADPNDPSVAAKFRETVLEPALDKYRDSFSTEGGQKFAEAHIDALRNHMFEKTAADMSSLAADAVAVNVRTTANSLSNTAMSDPSSVPHLLDSSDSLVGGMVNSSPNLKGAAASKARMELSEKMKESIVKAGALGAIQKAADPDGEAARWSAKYPEYINGGEVKQLATAAKYYQRVAQSEDRAARVQRDYEARNDFNTKVNALEAETMPKNVGDEPTLPKDYWQRLRELGTHPGAALEPGRLKTMVENGEAITARLNRPEPIGRVSHETTMDLLGRMRPDSPNPMQDNGPIYQAYKDNKLTRDDFNFLNREFVSGKSPEGSALDRDRTEFFKRYAPAIDPTIGQTGVHSALGVQKMYEAEMAARRQEGVLRSQGKDPHLAYDPTSPEFFGKPENIAKYRASLQDAQAYQASIEKPAAKPEAFKPPAGWQFSPSRQQYRDPSGKIYDINGKEVK